MFLEHLKDALVISVIQFGIGDLIAAGAKGGGGGVLQKPQFFGIFQSHIEQAVIQNALDAVLRTQHLSDGARLQSRVDHAVSTGVDHGRGASGLADDAGASQFIHIKYLQLYGI